MPLLLALRGCDRAEKAPPQAGRPVQVVKVEASLLTAGVELSGEIQAEKTVSLDFRIAGRIAERPVNVGDRVAPGQIVAKLDRTIETNAVAAAEAALRAARGEVVTARSTFERQERLMGQCFTTRPRFDAAQKAQETAQAALEKLRGPARTGPRQARLHRSARRCRRRRDGAQRRAGEVVQPGQPILQIAREEVAMRSSPCRRGCSRAIGRSAVRVVLAEAPGVSASGRIREIDPAGRSRHPHLPVPRRAAGSPRGDAAGIDGRRLGRDDLGAIMSIPAKALTTSGRGGCGLDRDPKTSTVSLRPIDILRFRPRPCRRLTGLAPGETIVATGVQALHPGQRVHAAASRAQRGERCREGSG